MFILGEIQRRIRIIIMITKVSQINLMCLRKHLIEIVTFMASMVIKRTITSRKKGRTMTSMVTKRTIASKERRIKKGLTFVLFIPSLILFQMIG